MQGVGLFHIIKEENTEYWKNIVFGAIVQYVKIWTDDAKAAKKLWQILKLCGKMKETVY